MKRRSAQCAACPFRGDRRGTPIPQDVMDEVRRRIAAGEEWVCHQTCDGPRVTERSLLCAGVS